MSVIEVSRLTKDYGSGKGIFDVNLSGGKSLASWDLTGRGRLPPSETCWDLSSRMPGK